MEISLANFYMMPSEEMISRMISSGSRFKDVFSSAPKFRHLRENDIRIQNKWLLSVNNFMDTHSNSTVCGMSVYQGIRNYCHSEFYILYTKLHDPKVYHRCMLYDVITGIAKMMVLTDILFHHDKLNPYNMDEEVFNNISNEEIKRIGYYTIDTPGFPKVVSYLKYKILDKYKDVEYTSVSFMIDYAKFIYLEEIKHNIQVIDQKLKEEYVRKEEDRNKEFANKIDLFYKQITNKLYRSYNGLDSIAPVDSVDELGNAMKDVCMIASSNNIPLDKILMDQMVKVIEDIIEYDKKPVSGYYIGSVPVLMALFDLYSNSFHSTQILQKYSDYDTSTDIDILHVLIPALLHFKPNHPIQIFSIITMLRHYYSDNKEDFEEYRKIALLFICERIKEKYSSNNKDNDNKDESVDNTDKSIDSEDCIKHDKYKINKTPKKVVCVHIKDNKPSEFEKYHKMIDENLSRIISKLQDDFLQSLIDMANNK